jgi:hypothetical protein
VNPSPAWAALGVTLAVLVAYEAWLALAARRAPRRLAHSAHATLREEWFAAVGAHPGSEVLAVQTLRNALMSATMTASTAALALMGTLALAAPSLHASLDAGSSAVATPRIVLELALLALLFGSLFASAMAVRYYNHASFIGAMPVGSDARARWNALGSAYLRRAGLMYRWGLRQLILVAPVVVAIIQPLAGPVAALVVVAVLLVFDRADDSAPAP